MLGMKKSYPFLCRFNKYLTVNWAFPEKFRTASCLRTTEFQEGLNFENSRVGKKKYWKISDVGESFDEIPREERKKKQWKVVKVLMEFKRGTVSENGYPQEGYVLFLEKFFIEINLILSKSVFIVLSRKNYNKVLRRKG